MLADSHSRCRRPRPAPLAASSWTSCFQSAWWLRRSYSSRTSPPEWSPACPWRATTHTLIVNTSSDDSVCVCVWSVCVCFLHQWAAAPLHRWCSPPWCLPESRRGSRRGLWSPAACLQHRTAFITASHPGDLLGFYQRAIKEHKNQPWAIFSYLVLFLCIYYRSCAISGYSVIILVSFILAKCKTYSLCCYCYSAFTDWFGLMCFYSYDLWVALKCCCIPLQWSLRTNVLTDRHAVVLNFSLERWADSFLPLTKSKLKHSLIFSSCSSVNAALFWVM